MPSDTTPTEPITDETKASTYTSMVWKFSRYGYWFCMSLVVFLIGGISLTSQASWFWTSQTTSNPYLSETLLAMRYNKVVYPTSHNSYAVVGTIAAANQFETIQVSLENGVRALMLDLHFTDDSKSKIALCHADCRAGSVEVEAVFDTIATFLESYPANIVTLIWETACTGDEECASLKHMLYTVEENSRLANLLYAPENPGNPWLTLQQMVLNNEKVVQFFDQGPFERRWDLPMWQNMIETTFDNKDKSDLDAACKFGRGISDNPEGLFLQNVFTLMGLVPSPAATVAYNTNPYMYNRVIRCQIELGKATTNFIAVDHWSYSDVVKTAACLNGEYSAQTCQTEDTGKTLSTIAISLIGGCTAFLVAYGLVLLYSRVSKQKPPVVDDPTELDVYPLLRGVSMASIDDFK